MAFWNRTPVAVDPHITGLCELLQSRPLEWTLRDDSGDDLPTTTTVTHRSSGLSVTVGGYLSGVGGNRPGSTERTFRQFDRRERRLVLAAIGSLRAAHEAADREAINAAIGAARADYGETARILAQMVLDGRADVRPLLDALLDHFNG